MAEICTEIGWTKFRGNDFVRKMGKNRVVKTNNEVF